MCDQKTDRRQWDGLLGTKEKLWLTVASTLPMARGGTRIRCPRALVDLPTSVPSPILLTGHVRPIPSSFRLFTRQCASAVADDRCVDCGPDHAAVTSAPTARDAPNSGA
jgi:hypothetical protein